MTRFSLNSSKYDPIYHNGKTHFVAICNGDIVTAEV